MLETIVILLAITAGVLVVLLRAARQSQQATQDSLEQLRAALQMQQADSQKINAGFRARDAATAQAQVLAPEPMQLQNAEASPDLINQLKVRMELLSSLLNDISEVVIVVNSNLQVVEFNSIASSVFPGVDRGRLLTDVAGNWPGLVTLSENALSYHDTDVEEQMVIGQVNYLVHASYRDTGESPIVTLILEDITQLVRLNRARRDMVANISHELRHPIANIRLIIDGLFHEQDKPKRKDSISSLRQIAHETDLLLWLVQAMHDLSMIESGQAIVKMVECNLSELVDVALERLSGQLERKKVTVARHIPGKIEVLCDRDLIHRVIFNLVHNAIKWSPEGGAVTLGAEVAGEEVILNVYDSGPGVPAGQVERIFERFYQVDPSRSGKEGTGLGLAISKHIVEAHGGRIWAEPNIHGQGGRFRFSLLNATSTLEPITDETTEISS